MKNRFREKGVILVITFLILGVLLILGSYFLTFALIEARISQSQVVATQTYYLAEAGINEAIWKIKNDPVWETNFEEPPTCYDWTDSFTKENILFSDSSYQVQIQNSDCARGQIIATSTLAFAKEKTAQRVVKTKVFKAIGSLTEDSGVLSGGSSENINISASVLNVYDGNFTSNHNTDIKLFSEVNAFDNLTTSQVEGKALANGNINVSWSSQLNATATCAKNICQGDCLEEGCPASSIPMPMIDFDSEDPNSYKQKAQAAEDAGNCSVWCGGAECDTRCVFTDGEFEDLLWQVGKGGVLTLNNEITYVTGPIELRGERQLVVNGTLVTDGTVDIGERYCWTNQGQKHCGYNQITINDPGVGVPSGLLTKSKLNFGLYSSFQNIDITGLLYATDEMRMVSMPQSFIVTGGILARKISLTSTWSAVNVYLDNTIIAEAIWAGPEPPAGETPPYSPVVTIEHWEESY
jgi:Tfp pilus assembly protein PilX